MKLQEDLFDRITSEINVYEAFYKSLEGDSKYDAEAMVFIVDAVYNLKQLRQSLINGTYRFDGYFEFDVYEPKKRTINAPKRYKDKLTQLIINNILKEVYYPCFIYDSYACIDDKGTHSCVDRIQYLMRRAAWEYGDEAATIKGDVKKFFYSIDRSKLKKILKKRIKCKRTLKLLFHIIDSADDIGPLGLPLGNTLSQMFANIYMNELDQYCKRTLGLKYYIRYMDDFFIFVENKEEAKRVLDLINIFIEEELGLKLNKKKTKYFPIHQGLNAIGYKIYTTRVLLRDKSKKNIKRKIKAMPKLILEGHMTISKAEQMLNSWKGHAEHGDSYNFILYLLKRYEFLYLESKGVKTILRIDMDKLYSFYDSQANQAKQA